MKKINITLAKGIQLKTELEKSIDSDNQLIENTNLTTILSNKKEVIEQAVLEAFETIEAIETAKEIKSELLVILQVLIQENNTKSIKWGGVTNTENIKRLSEFQREKAHLNRINTKIDHNKKTILYPVLSFEEVTKRIRIIEKETETISKKITEFNENFKITVKVDETLFPILEIVGIK